MKLYYNQILLTDETILKTRKYFYELCVTCIEKAKAGEYYVNDLEKYIVSESKRADRYLNGENDRVLAFLQRAYYLQTGESVALMNF